MKIQYADHTLLMKYLVNNPNEIAKMINVEDSRQWMRDGDIDE